MHLKPTRVAAVIASIALFVCFIIPRARAQDAPTITDPPQTQTVIAPNSVTFSVGATGTSPLGYQWYYTNSLVTNVLGTGSSYTIPTTQLNNGGYYFVVVSNAYGSVASPSALLTVVVPASFRTQPASCSAPMGTTAAFAFSANGTYPFGYQWFLNGAPIATGTVALDAQVSTYITPPITATNLGTYSVVVTNAGGTATSSNVVLAVGPISVFPNTITFPNLTPATALYPPPTNVIAMAAGGNTTVLLHSDGTLTSYGSLTNPPLTNVVAISGTDTGNGDALLALLADGTVYGWGARSAPPQASNIVAISSGINAICLRRDGTILSSPDTNTFPTTLSHIVQGCSGLSQNMALRDDGTAVVWDQQFSTAMNIPASATNIVAIASGNGNCLALGVDGRLVTWGSGAATNVPAQLTNASAPAVAAICSNGRNNPAVVNQESALALLTNGTVVAWGSDNYGQTNVPLGLSNVVSIAQGTIWSMALVNDSTPQILQPPVGGTFYSGTDNELQGRAVGTPPLFYQWTFNGTNITDATNSTLAFLSIQPNDAGTYQLLVTNSLGSTASVPVPVHIVDSAPLLVVQPFSRTVYAGSSVTLNSVVDGSGPMAIQWRFANSKAGPVVDIPDATNADLVLNPIRPTDSGSYFVVASNSFGSITSTNAALLVRQVVAWGDNTYGKTNVPATLTNAIAVCGGNYYSSFALRDDGTVLTWGLGGTVTNVGYTNIVELSCSYSGGSAPLFGLRMDGTVVSSGLVPAYSNVVATMSGIVAMESDTGGCTFLKPDGTIVRLYSGGTTNLLNVSNILALSQWDDGFQALRADGTVFSYGTGASVPTVTNVASTYSSRYAGTFLRRDQSIVDWGSRTTTTSITNNYLAIASTGLSTELGVRTDGSLLTWGATQPATNVPPGLPKLRVIDGGYNGFIALCTPQDFDPTFLHTALNTTNLVVSSRNSPQWYAQHDVTHDHATAARSAAIGRNTASSMRMLVTNGPISLGFWWKVSSETNHDFLSFSIGGVPQAAISGEVDWQHVVVNIPAGPQMLVWTYSKDSSGTSGLDAGFVDELLFGPQPPIILAQPKSQTVLGGSMVNFSVVADGQTPLTYRWFRAPNDPFSKVPGTNIITLNNVYRYNSGLSLFVVVSNSVGTVTSSNAVLTVHTPQDIAVPLLQPDGTFLVTSRDADNIYMSSATSLVGFQAQYSSNLVDWLPVNAMLSISNGSIQFIDTDATNDPLRFYRIIENW